MLLAQLVIEILGPLISVLTTDPGHNLSFIVLVLDEYAGNHCHK